MTHDFNYDDLLSLYRGLGLDSGRVVYVTGNFGRLGRYYQKGRESVLQDHINAIQEIIGINGTLVVPTHSWSLCNTNKIFDIKSVKSETGPFTEQVRIQKDSVRQFHPFSSLTAIGCKSVEICTNNSRHVFGHESPFQRMIEMDALYISIGQPMERSISLVHHIELIMGVPYRYTKEFVQPCLIDGKVKMVEFYVYVTRNECDIIRDRNEKIMHKFRKSFTMPKVSIGRSFSESLNMKDFFQATTKEFSKEMYIWLKNNPKVRPYRE
jgi:aminoglycoside 3-N-acetyltransferase